MHIGVLGAGVVGLTTALQLQEEFRNAKISIIADKFNENTTSYVAAGIFRPGNGFAGPTFDVTKKWVNDAYNYWDNIRKSAEAPLAGVCSISGYIFSSASPSVVRNQYMEGIVPVYRKTTEEELTLCKGDWKYGAFFTSVLTEGKLYLPYAASKFKRNGGEIIEKRISSLLDLDKKFDAIVNCSGFGAKELCSDYKVIPIRGQVIKVKAPWIKTAFYGDYDTYIIPGFEGVTLGGCRNYDSYSLEISKYDSASIRERCTNLLPSLKDAKTIREAVGLRPHRDIVRVEPEIMNGPSGSRTKVVHNYGHGGYGVTTSPGTSIYAVKLLHELLLSNSKL